MNPFPPSEQNSCKEISMMESVDRQECSWRKTTLVSLYLAATLFFLAPAVRAQEEPSLAPWSPAFEQYLQDVEFGKAKILKAGEFPPGIVPPPVEFPRKVLKSMEFVTAALPSAYDLRKKNRVTSVKDQGSCGCCWAFATYGSLESRLMPKETWDFSEENLIETHGFDKTPCQGGNFNMAAAYLARWSGPIRESADPYTHAAVRAAPKPAKHVAEAVFLPERATPEDNDSLKTIVKKYGGVAAYMYYSSSYYDSSNYAYYYGGSSSTNHGITIVGWDDNFSREKFKAYNGSAPSGDGAFIVKNTWGEDFGEKGYFYVSYYDTSIEPYMAFSTVDAATKYNLLFQYDPLGAVTGLGFSSTRAWGANIFKAKVQFSLKAVGFHTLVPNTSFIAYVYKDVAEGQPRSGTLVAKVKGKFPMAGYHTVPVDPVKILKGQRFSVVIRFTTPNYNYPVPIESPVPNYSSNATSAAGQSFMSSGGTVWSDVYQTFTNSNVCIKAMGVK